MIRNVICSAPRVIVTVSARIKDSIIGVYRITVAVVLNTACISPYDQDCVDCGI